MISFFIVFLNLGAKLLAFQHIETGLQWNPHFWFLEPANNSNQKFLNQLLFTLEAWEIRIPQY